MNRRPPICTWAEHEPYQLVGNDGAIHWVWARSDREALSLGRKWAYKHDGLAELSHVRVANPTIAIDEQPAACFTKIEELRP